MAAGGSRRRTPANRNASTSKDQGPSKSGPPSGRKASKRGTAASGRGGSPRARGSAEGAADLPPRPSSAQRRATDAIRLTPAQQSARWSTHSAGSERREALAQAVRGAAESIRPGWQDVFDYNMPGIASRRGVQVADWRGTMDPNWVRIYITERRRGLSIHVWEPFGLLQRHRDRLEEAGYKPKVGCIEFNRKGPAPAAPLLALVEAVAKRMAAEDPADAKSGRGG